MRQVLFNHHDRQVVFYTNLSVVYVFERRIIKDEVFWPIVEIHEV